MSTFQNILVYISIRITNNINKSIMFETIIDSLIATCICAVGVGLPLSIYVAICEYVDKKFNLYDKISKFFNEPEED